MPASVPKDFHICSWPKNTFPKGVMGAHWRKQGVVMGICPLPLQVGFKAFSDQLLRHLTHTRFGLGLDQQTGRGLHLTSPVTLPNPGCPDTVQGFSQCWPTPTCINLGAWHRLYHIQAPNNTQPPSSPLKNRTKHKSLISTNVLQIYRTSSI